MGTQPQHAPSIAPEDSVEATDYEIAVSIPDKEMRILFRNGSGVLSTHIMRSDEVYAFAQRMLRGYDRIEGI